MLVAIVAAVATILIFVLYGRTESESKAARDFMVALSHGKTAELAKLSFIEGDSEEQLKAKWDKSFTFAKQYRFVWVIKRSAKASENEASVSLGVWRNAGNPSTYEEKYDLPLSRINGKWKVDVKGISRTMFPALPR